MDIGSGLDTTSIIDAIVNARRAPRETILNNKITQREVQISAFSEIKNSLNSLKTNLALYDGLNGLGITSNGTAVKATITNPDIADKFSHKLEVNSLATSQTLVFDGYSSASTTLGTGTLSFSFGTWSGSSFTANGTTKTATVASGNGTLEGIADSINDANIGVTASVIKKTATNYALVIQAPSGLANAMQISVTEDDASSSFDALTYTSYNSSTQVVAGADASLTLDGVSITRDSNSISDLIDGVTLDVSSTTTSAETLTAKFDTTTAQLAAEGFVAEVNNIISLLKTNYNRDPDASLSGNLAGDPLVGHIINQITSTLSAEISGFGASSVYLANFGILTNRDGTLSLNTTTFKKEYEANPDSFNAIVNSRVTTGSSLVSGTMHGTSYVPGSYNLAFSGSAATLAGDSMTLSDGVYSIASGNASGLQITIDGSGADTTVYVGESLVDKLIDIASTNLAYGNDFDERISDYNSDISDFTERLADFDNQMATLRAKYVDQFAAMDSAVASLNKTKDSLNMMMDGWRASMK